MRLGYEIDDDEEETGSEPWALGDLDLEPLELVVDDDDGFGEAEGWLDEQLGRVRSDGPHSDGSSDPEASDSAAIVASAPEGDGGEVVLRRSAPTRSPRRRR